MKRAAEMRPDPEHDDSSHAEGAAPSRSQYGALCWRKKGKHVEVLLITSRDTGRWLVPKGWPIDGLGGAGSAAREAFEEAGVEGEIAEQPLGYYSYVKARARQGKSREDLPCVVAVYPMRVGRLLDRYPERGERRRKWFTAAKAALKVAEPELREILAGCEAVLLSAPQAEGAGAAAVSAPVSATVSAGGEA